MRGAIKRPDLVHTLSLRTSSLSFVQFHPLYQCNTHCYFAPLSCAAHFNPLSQNVHLPLFSNLLHYHLKCYSLPTTPPGVITNPTLFSSPFLSSYFHLVKSTSCSSPSSDSCLPPLLAPLQQRFVVAAVESASYTCEDCWPWWLGLAAAMINASTRQEASTSTCPANIYLLTHIIPVTRYTGWWTNLNPPSSRYSKSTALCSNHPFLPFKTLLRRNKNWMGGGGSQIYFLFLLRMIKHAALGSSRRCTCLLPFDKAVTCTYFALRKKKCLCVFGCEVKNPSRTNALRRKAVLPLGAPYSLLEQSIKQNKAFKQWITTDRSFRHHKQEAQYKMGID